MPSRASGSAAPVCYPSGLLSPPLGHTWQPGGGQVRHKSRTLAALPDACNAQLSQKQPQVSRALRRTNKRTNAAEVLRSAPRESAFDERCGTSRCRFHRSAAAGVGAGRRRRGRGRPPLAGGRAPGPLGLARRTRRSRDARALLARGAAEPGAHGRRCARGPAGGAGARAGIRPNAADDRKTGASVLTDGACEPRPCALPAVRQRPAGGAARRQVTRRSPCRARRHQPRGRSEPADRRAGARGTVAARRARGTSCGAGRRAGRPRRGRPRSHGDARRDDEPTADVHRRAAPAAGAERGPDRIDRGGSRVRPTCGRRRSLSQHRLPRLRRSRSPRRASQRRASAR